MKARRFIATVESRPRGSIAIRLPFDPNDAWGPKDRHYVVGSIDGRRFRGSLATADGDFFLQLGPTWCRDPNVGRPGTQVAVVLEPEGPQFNSLAADFAQALVHQPEARRFFESLATFYRNGYVAWIESAKRPETRARRIADVVTALQAGRRERATAGDR